MKPAGSTIDPQAGFSLIEVLVALAIGAILMTGASLALVTGLQARETLLERTARLGELEQMQALLKEDLFFTVRRPMRDASGRVLPPFELGQASDGTPVLSLMRSGWANPGQREARSSLQRVVWSVEDGALVRRAWARPDPSAQTPVDRRVMVHADASIAFSQYLNGTWRGPQALSLSAASAWPMPTAIGLDLDTEAHGQLRFVFLTSASGTTP